MNRQKHLAYGLLFLGIAEALYPANAAAQTLPSGFGSATNVGTPTINGNTMTVNVTGPRGYAEWTSFNVAPGFVFDVTNTSTPNNYIFVNRVTGGTVSDISGLVRANGNLWLINPNGISVGSTGVFDVGGLLLSTATTLNNETEATNGAAFLGSTSPTFTFGGANAQILVAPGAQLLADTGVVAAVANGVNFQGRAAAGTGEVALVGSTAAVIGLDSDLNAVTYLQMDTGSNLGTAMTVANASFNAARTVIASTGMVTGQGSMLLGNGSADNIRFEAGNVVLYAGAYTSAYGAQVAIADGTVQPGFVVNDGARITQSGRISAPGDLRVVASGGLGAGGQDIDLRAGRNLQVDAATYGRDVAMQANGTLVTQEVFARDDIVLRGATGLTTRNIVAGTTVSGQVATDAAGSADALAGAGLTGNDVDISAGTGNVDLNGISPIVPGDYTVTGGDFYSNTFSPNFMGGTNNRFTINDTMGGLVLGAFTVPGFFVVNMSNGGSLTTLGTIVSQTGDVVFTTTGGGDLDLNGNIVATGPGRGVTLDASGAVRQNTGGIFTTTLWGNATRGLYLDSASNQVQFANLANNGSGDVAFSSLSSFYRVGSATNAGGSIRLTGSNGITLASNVSAAANVSVTGAARIEGARSVTAGGTIGFSSTVAGTTPIDALTTTAGAGTTFTGNVSGLDRLVVNGDARFNGTSVTATNGIDLDNVTIGNSGSMSFTTSGGFVAGNVASPTSNVTVEGGSVNVGSITAGDTVALRNAFLRANTGALTLGSATANGVTLIGNTGITATGAITANILAANSTNGALALDGANRIGTLMDLTGNGISLSHVGNLTLQGPVNGRTGNVRLATTGGNFTIGSGGTIRGNEVVVSTDRAFVNQNGANAITVSNRWLVYSAAPAGNTFGNLDSGNTALWNATFGTRAPSTIGPGNRYVFAFQPTLTFSTIDVVKTYGYDGSMAPTDFYYMMSGLQPGVAGAFLGDTAASAFLGSPFVSSTGFDARADVNGGPYAIAISNGTLASNSGYAFAFNGSGRLSVSPRPITGTPGVDAKTYDGTTSGTGNIVLNGVLSGDDVGATAMFTFLDPNAGTAKTVTVTGATLTGGDAGNYTLTLPATALGDILQRALTGTVTIDTRTYDGTRNASGTIVLSGTVAGDDVGAGATFTFVDKDAGTGKTVTITGATLTGADAGNYTLTMPATTLGTILQRALTGTVTIDTKTYDGNRAGTGTISLGGVVAGDNVGATATFTFGDKHAGTSKTVMISGATLTGTDAGNYTLTLPATALGDILQRAIGGTVTVTTKTYDGTRSATGTIVLTGTVAGDDVGAGATFTFVDKNAGTAKTVNITGATLTGADAGNYTLTLSPTALGDILQRAITGTPTVDTKTYDGTTSATGSIALGGGVVAGDDVLANALFAFLDKNAGAGKTVAITGVTLTGADAGNYTLSVPASALGDILRKSINGAVVVDTKIYDGTLAGTGGITLSGVLAGDSVGANGTYTFADANAGTGRTVNVSGTLTGADAGNYTLVVPAATVADILQRAITVTADPQSKGQGDSDPTLTWTLTDGTLVGGDTLSGTLSRVPGEDPGAYAIGQGTLSASANYQLTFVGGTLTITPVAEPTPPPPTPTPPRPSLPDDTRGVLAHLAEAAPEDAGALPIADCREEAHAAACEAQAVKH